MQRRTHARRRLARLFESGLGLLVASLEALAFWAAALFPLFYIGGYAAYALSGSSMPAVRLLGVLLGANVLALVLGHQYDGRPKTAVPDAVIRRLERTDRGGNRP